MILYLLRLLSSRSLFSKRFICFGGSDFVTASYLTLSSLTICREPLISNGSGSLFGLISAFADSAGFISVLHGILSKTFFSGSLISGITFLTTGVSCILTATGSGTETSAISSFELSAFKHVLYTKLYIYSLFEKRSSILVGCTFTSIIAGLILKCIALNG